MSTGAIAIPIAFLILVSLLLWLIIDVRGKWWLKALLMLLVVSFSGAVWKSLDSYLGWPTPGALPQRAILLWAAIDEPNFKTGNSGAVYLWLKPREIPPKMALFSYIPTPADPRAYKLPYSRQLHKDAAKAMLELLSDKSMEIEFKVKEKDKRYGYWGAIASGNAPGSVKFYKLPPPKVPPKLIP